MTDDLEVNRRERREPSGKGPWAVPSAIPFEDYIMYVVDTVQETAADNRTEWKTGFELVRMIRAHPEARRLPPRQIWKRLSRYLSDDYASTYDLVDLEAAFFDAWAIVRLPEGVNPLDAALEKSALKPLRLHPTIAAIRPEGYELFISLAGWLTVILDSSIIKLPVEGVGRVLGVTPMTVSRYRRMAIQDGFLKERKPHRYAPDGQGEATTEVRP